MLVITTVLMYVSVCVCMCAYLCVVFRYLNFQSKTRVLNDSLVLNCDLSIFNDISVHP